MVYLANKQTDWIEIAQNHTFCDVCNVTTMKTRSFWSLEHDSRCCFVHVLYICVYLAKKQPYWIEIYDNHAFCDVCNVTTIKTRSFWSIEHDNRCCFVHVLYIWVYFANKQTYWIEIAQNHTFCDVCNVTTMKTGSFWSIEHINHCYLVKVHIKLKSL